MNSAPDLDIFKRSMSGDRRARTEFYKKFVAGSSRVRRLGAGYDDEIEFLHDTFSNVLRTGHSWHKRTDLAEWVENVAQWTALQNQRRRDMAKPASGLRMCAETEGDDARRREVTGGYAPPVREAGDSPQARLEAMLPELEREVLRERAVKNAAWEEVAAAAGKPLSSVGPAFVRAATRLARLFGASPPMDDDLVPVFERAAEDPMQPEGRSISIQLDGVFYDVTPEMHRIGLTTAYEARMVVLWDAAAGGGSPGEGLQKHLDACTYCSDLLEALIRMKYALRMAVGDEFRLCPGSFTLAMSGEAGAEALEQHVAQCQACRVDRDRLLGAPGEYPEGGVAEPQGAGKKTALVGVLLLLGAGAYGGYRYYSARQAEAAQAAAMASASGKQQTVAFEPKYRDLVQEVPFDDGKILASVLPENRPTMKWVIDQFSVNSVDQALGVSAQLADKGKDPGAVMVYAMTLYKTHWTTDGYREMLKSEAMTPRNSLRCWVMLQFSLMVGDKPVMEREAAHLKDDPTYGAQVAKLMEKVRQR